MNSPATRIRSFAIYNDKRFRRRNLSKARKALDRSISAWSKRGQATLKPHFETSRRREVLSFGRLTRLRASQRAMIAARAALADYSFAPKSGVVPPTLGGMNEYKLSTKRCAEFLQVSISAALNACFDHADQLIEIAGMSGAHRERQKVPPAEPFR
jgi:hypothetical protein